MNTEKLINIPLTFVVLCMSYPNDNQFPGYVSFVIKMGKKWVQTIPFTSQLFLNRLPYQTFALHKTLEPLTRDIMHYKRY